MRAYLQRELRCKKELRGKHIGKKLVSDCLIQGKLHGFKNLQFNEVVTTNESAKKLYERLDFVKIGTVKGGFRLINGNYEDICLYYKTL